MARRLELIWIGMGAALLAVGCSASPNAVPVQNASPYLTRVGPDTDGSVAYLGLAADASSGLFVASGSNLAQLGSESAEALSFGWFPDGESLFLISSGDGDHPRPGTFWIVSADGGHEQQLEADLSLTSEFGFVDVDTGRGRAYFAGREPTLLGGPSDLYWLDLDSGRVTQLTDTPRSERYPQIVDENRIAYVGLGVEVLDTTTDTIITLSDDDQTVGAIDLSPANDWVVYDATEGNDRTTNGLWFAPVDGSSPPVQMHTTEGRWPSLSHDGRYVLVTIPGETPSQQGRLEWLEVPAAAPWLQD